MLCKTYGTKPIKNSSKLAKALKALGDRMENDAEGKYALHGGNLLLLWLPDGSADSEVEADWERANHGRS